ncbi:MULTISPECIES: CAP domain-containing protein [Cyanophyceae]|uniref:CAP domain-containing protein n=1 Tax=Cyanophyceae TaxID=3028117 RepID=UPI00016DC530|nr:MULTISPECIES: CAP domain-containing protein [Cyanophyceae]ACA98977.1 Pathogenesis-related protein PR-1 precursor [Picosynechococcus sp. PCC 7002]SMH36161.1 Agenet domain-containing protein [Picosynechococcus sp. OG1]SMQ77676.1 Agenet domain-containing protein [Synechococcus sp. 7002]
MFIRNATAIALLGLFWFQGAASNSNPVPQGPTPILLAQATIFEVGDKVDIERQGSWRPGEILAIQSAPEAAVRYQVRYLDVGFVEDNVSPERLRPTVATQPVAGRLPQINSVSEPIYVERDGVWVEASIRSYSYSSRTGNRFTVQYRDNGRLETDVVAQRVRSVAEAKAAGIEVSEFDLSTQAGIEQMLAAHNEWRSPHNLPDLVWSETLANHAQTWAERLAAQERVEHNTSDDYGENIAKSSNLVLSPTAVVNLWGNEIQDYDYGTNRCQPGKVCGHYTQIVWRDTEKVGCGMVRKDNGWEVWVCNYDPPGNYRGQRPY